MKKEFSANVYIGRHLEPVTFLEYVQPVCEQHGLYVTDMMPVSKDIDMPSGKRCYAGKDRQPLVVSLAGETSGETNFSELLENILLTAALEIETLDKDGGEQKKFGYRAKIPYLNDFIETQNHHELLRTDECNYPIYGDIWLPIYEIIGIYRGIETASELFPAIAQKHLAQAAAKELDEVSEKMKELAGKTLGDFAKQ